MGAFLSVNRAGANGAAQEAQMAPGLPHKPPAIDASLWVLMQAYPGAIHNGLLEGDLTAEDARAIAQTEGFVARDIRDGTILFHQASTETLLRLAGNERINAIVGARGVVFRAEAEIDDQLFDLGPGAYERAGAGAPPMVLPAGHAAASAGLDAPRVAAPMAQAHPFVAQGGIPAAPEQTF